jgi:hypothetical protein
MQKYDNKYFNKFYDYPKELKEAINNIYDIYVTNMPSSPSTVIVDGLNNRFSITFNVALKDAKYVYAKINNIYVAYDSRLGSYSFLEECVKGYKRTIRARNLGKVFKNKGISTITKTFRGLSPKEIKERYNLELLPVRYKKRNDDYVYGVYHLVDKRVIDYKLAQVGICIMGYENKVIEGQK